MALRNDEDNRKPNTLLDNVTCKKTKLKDVRDTSGRRRRSVIRTSSGFLRWGGREKDKLRQQQESH